MSKLLSLFGPSKREIWKQLCRKIDAEFIPGKGFFGRDAIQAYHGNWTIIIDTEKRGRRRYTRIRAPYVNRDSFHFRILQDSGRSKIGRITSTQDFIVGHPEFDEHFIVQGNDQFKLKKMFDNGLIRNLLHYQARGTLTIDLDESWVTDPFREGVSELRFTQQGVQKDLDRLHSLYDLFAATLDHLCHIGSAYEDDPFKK